jgi:hypothetical protein
MEKELITIVLENAAKKYTESPATSNAGFFLRFLAKVTPWKVIVKMFAHKLSK